MESRSEVGTGVGCSLQDGGGLQWGWHECAEPRFTAETAPWTLCSEAMPLGVILIIRSSDDIPRGSTSWTLLVFLCHRLLAKMEVNALTA